MDAVRLKNMLFFAFHGQKESEAVNGQRFEVDVEIAGDLSLPGRTDNLADTYNYELIYKEVKSAVTESRFHIVEALGEEICRRIHAIYPEAFLKVTIRKPHAPLQGVLDYAEIELVREGKSGKLR
jgi:dihydroneopterin aldolase